MTFTTIRQAGPYAITTDGERVYVNGTARVALPARAGSPVVRIVETGCRGANGKMDVVGLTSEHWAIHEAACAALRLARTVAPQSLRQVRADLAGAVTDLQDAAYEADHAAVQGGVETGRIAIAPSRAAEIEAARTALATFDAAHPEIVAEIKAARDAQSTETRRIAWDL